MADVTHVPKCWKKHKHTTVVYTGRWCSSQLLHHLVWGGHVQHVHSDIFFEHLDRMSASWAAEQNRTEHRRERVMWLFLQKVERCRKKCFVSTRVVRKCYQWKLDFKSHSDWYRLVKRNFWVLLGPRGWLYMHNVCNFLFAIMHQIHYFSFRIHKYEWNKLN